MDLQVPTANGIVTVRRRPGRPPGSKTKWSHLPKKLEINYLDIQRLCADQSIDNLRVIIDIRDNAKDPRVRLMACNMLLDRAYGRPREQEDTGTAFLAGNMAGLPDPQLIERVSEALKRQGLVIVPAHTVAKPTQSDTLPQGGIPTYTEGGSTGEAVAGDTPQPTQPEFIKNK